MISKLTEEKVLIAFASFGIISNLCPAPEVLNPCECNANAISCGGNYLFELKNIFDSIHQTLADNQKRFKNFYLNNTANWKKILFFDITFDEIEIELLLNAIQR